MQPICYATYLVKLLPGRRATFYEYFLHLILKGEGGRDRSAKQTDGNGAITDRA